MSSTYQKRGPEILIIKNYTPGTNRNPQKRTGEQFVLKKDPSQTVNLQKHLCLRNYRIDIKRFNCRNGRNKKIKRIRMIMES